MSRQSAEYLNQANYKNWKMTCAMLRTEKKAGKKLSPQEKAVLRTVPTAENPFRGVENATPIVRKNAAKPKVAKIKKNPSKVGPTTEFKIQGGRELMFVCETLNKACTDVDCQFNCKKTDCFFYQRGYFRFKDAQKKVATMQNEKKQKALRLKESKKKAAAKFAAKKKAQVKN